MDQILHNETSVPQYAMPENQSSVLSVEYYIKRAVSGILNQFIDAALFYDKGAYLYVWNNALNMVKLYGIASVYNYSQERARMKDWILSSRDKVGSIACMSRFVHHYDLCASVVTESAEQSSSFRSRKGGISEDVKNIVENTREVHASDFIFRILCDKYHLFQNLTYDQKHKLGLFLISAIKLETEEKNRIEAYLKKNTNTSYLDAEECLKYDNSLDEKFLEALVSTIATKEQYAPLTKRESGDIQLMGSESAQVFYSAWYIALAFIKYVEDRKTSPLKKDQIGQLSFLKGLSNHKRTMSMLVHTRKRTQECMFQLTVCKYYLPSVEEYEKEVQKPDRDKELVKILINIPQVLATGQCIDKQELFDLTVEKNIRKILETLKSQSKESFMNENLRKIIEFMESPQESMEIARNVIKKEVNVFFKNLIQGFKSQFYNEFFMPSHVLHVTLPLIGSLYFTQEMLRLAQQEFSKDFQSISKMAVYGLFPLVLSIIYETQESVVDAYNYAL